MTAGLLLIAIFVVAFTMIAERLSATVITAPMVFLGFGLALSGAGFFPAAEAEEALHLTAEIALILLLFLDASQVNIAILRRKHTWPVRMLLVGLPASIALGTLALWPLLPGWPLAALALLAAILAPTDAALGQAVVTNPIVPERTRRALTVESGLNDGLALPAVLLFASLTAMPEGGSETNWASFAMRQILLGPAAGAVIGSAGGFALIQAHARGLSAPRFEGVGAVALAIAAYLGADLIGGNGFIAAFVAGLCFGARTDGHCSFVYEFTESEGQLLSWAAFLLVGLTLVPEALEALSMSTLAIIAASLFVVRPLAIWIALIGSDASAPTRLFFGWFGPRGLATVLFALVVVAETPGTYPEEILQIAVNAVWISALLHGLSALPLAKLYAERIHQKGDCAETQVLAEFAKPLTTRV